MRLLQSRKRNILIRYCYQRPSSRLPKNKFNIKIKRTKLLFLHINYKKGGTLGVVDLRLFVYIYIYTPTISQFKYFFRIKLKTQFTLQTLKLEMRILKKNRGRRISTTGMMVEGGMHSTRSKGGFRSVERY